MGGNDTQPSAAKSDLGLVAAIAVVGAVVFFGASWYLGKLGDRALTGEWDAAMGELRLLVGASSVLLAISSIALGVLLRRSGIRTLAQHRYPPVGSPVVTGLRESDGEAADRLGARLRLVGAIVMVFGVAAAATGLALVGKI